MPNPMTAGGAIMVLQRPPHVNGRGRFIRRAGDYDVITIQQTFDDFLIVANSRNLSASYKSIIARTRDYWLARHPDAPLDSLTPTHIRDWLTWLRDERKQSSASVDVHYRNLKAVMLFAEREEYLAHGKAPIRRVDRPVVDERQPDALTPDEVRGLLKRVKNSGDRNAYRDYALHLFFSVTCARLEEVSNLLTNKVFLGEGYALVYSNKTNAERPVPHQPRTLPRGTQIPTPPPAGR